MKLVASTCLVILSATAVADGNGPPDDPNKKQEGAKQSIYPYPSWYLAVGGEGSTHVSSLDELERTRADQFAAFPLPYIRPVTEDWRQESNGAFSVQFGVRLNDWLDVELAAHNWDSYYSRFSESEITNPTSSQSLVARHFTLFSEEAYSLTALPRWEYNPFIGVFGRVGLGISNSSIDSTLTTAGYSPPVRTCTLDSNNKETCRDVSDLIVTPIDEIHAKRRRIFPVVGVGIQLIQFVRLEYLYRFNVPIGNATTDVSALFLTFSFKGDFAEKINAYWSE